MHVEREGENVRLKGKTPYEKQKIYTYCLCTVGLINVPIKTAHIIPSTANVQYALANQALKFAMFSDEGSCGVDSALIRTQPTFDCWPVAGITDEAWGFLFASWVFLRNVADERWEIRMLR